MVSVDKYLAEVKVRAEKTTKGEWHWKAASPSTARVWADSAPVINEKIYLGDAEFIAHARTDIPRLVAMLEATRQALSDCWHENCFSDVERRINEAFAELDRIAGGSAL